MCGAQRQGTAAGLGALSLCRKQFVLRSFSKSLRLAYEDLNALTPRGRTVNSPKGKERGAAIVLARDCSV